MNTDKKEAVGAGSGVLRLSVNQRAQHVVLFLTLTVLAITGFTHKFHDNWLASIVLRLEGGMEARGVIHRVTAGIFMALCAYHVWYVTWIEWGHAELMKMKAGRKDIRDFIRVLKYDLGMAAEMPKFDKYSIIEKIQYWGVVAGSVMMIITGLMLWFETGTMTIMPKWILDVTTVVHGYEGVIAFIVLLLWHLYNVHLNPASFPMNMTWITGKISEENMKRNHSLEYERIAGEKNK